MPDAMPEKFTLVVLIDPAISSSDLIEANVLFASLNASLTFSKLTFDELASTSIVLRAFLIFTEDLFIEALAIASCFIA